MTNLFTYGSLMYPDIWRAVVRKTFPNQKALLDGYQRVFIRNDRYPVLKRCLHQKNLVGTLYQQLTPAHLRLLDAFEGKYYFRRTVKVKIPMACDRWHTVTAQTYCLKPHYQYLTSRRIWTTQHFEQKLKTQFQRTYCKRRWR